MLHVCSLLQKTLTEDYILLFSGHENVSHSLHALFRYVMSPLVLFKIHQSQLQFADPEKKSKLGNKLMMKTYVYSMWLTFAQQHFSES